MGSLARKAIGGSIHKIREFELEKVNLAEEFDILQIVGEGWFGKILLVEHKATDTEMVLKALPKPYSALRDFYREFHYGLHLGAHRNIITTYDVAFETAGFYVFSQEYAPLGDLTSNVSDTGIGELHTKRVARQLAAALEHLHVRDLVHRDVKLDNVLVFRSDFSRIKLCDFGETRRVGSVVRRQNEWLPYAPPEVLLLSNDNNYKTETIHDVWQFGIVMFVCLTGCLPWQKAAPDDPRYSRYLSWHNSSMPIRKQPKLFKLVSSKAQRLFRKFLEPKQEKRPPSLSDVHKYLDDRWMAKGSAEKNAGVSVEDDGLCPSMYSFHSSPEEKNKLLHSLTQYGIETTVDRGAKKDRIRAWIENSIIDEEEEEAEPEDDSENEERTGMLDYETGPVGERMDRGPIQAQKPNRQAGKTMDDKQKRREIRDAMISKRNSAIYIPPVDPRIPLEQQRLNRPEYQIPHILPKPPNKYFEKFSSKIATDVNNSIHETNLKKTKANEKNKLQDNQKSVTTSQPSSNSNESNRSNTQSDDSTIVNYQPNNETPSKTTASFKQYGKVNFTNQIKTKSVTTTQTSNPYVQSVNNNRGYINTNQKNSKIIATTQTPEPNVQNSFPNATRMTNVNNFNNFTRIDTRNETKRVENKTYTSQYTMKASLMQGRPMKDRYNMYDTREEKSSSSISNSTGRSVSK